MNEAGKWLRDLSIGSPSQSKRICQRGSVAGAPMVNSYKGVGRNDPCPCGSGKKFKKCCLNSQGLNKPSSGLHQVDPLAPKVARSIARIVFIDR
jgi:SEC-C motif